MQKKKGKCLRWSLFQKKLCDKLKPSHSPPHTLMHTSPTGQMLTQADQVVIYAHADPYLSHRPETLSPESST